MAERRMFARTIIDSDAFLDMPLSAQTLYFHLSMRGDDDGFINNPKKIQRMIGAADDDLKLLIAKRFIIPFESGIVVIKHWKIHNYIRKDRYKPTVYQEELSMLSEKENNSYTLDIGKACKPVKPISVTVGIPSDNQVGDKMETQDRIGEDRIGEVSLGEDKGNSSDSHPNNTLTDEKLSLIVKAFEQNGFGQLSQIVKDKLILLIDEYDITWINEAFKIAVENNKRNLKYVEGILRNWRVEGGMKTESSKSQKQVKSFNRKTKFHPQQSRAEKYSSDELDKVADRKRKQAAGKREPTKLGDMIPDLKGIGQEGD